MGAIFYFPAPDTLPSILYIYGNAPIFEKHEGSPLFKLEFSTRAFILLGKEVYIDAILEVVGSSWKSWELCFVEILA